MSSEFFTNHKTKILLLIALFLVPIPLFSINVSGLEQSDLRNVRVAIYSNRHSDELLASRIALESMFIWMNANVENINASVIRNGGLTSYDIFVMPGRSDSTTYSELENLGVDNVLNFVRNGGSYFGICGGVHFAARGDVNLFSGAVREVPGEAFLPHIVEMKLNTHLLNPELIGSNDTFSTLFWGSTYFVPDNPGQIHSIATYSNCNESGMIFYNFGLGSVFLSSPHVEFEENSARDGTSMFDAHNDLDSEWDFLLEISHWLVDTPNTQIAIIWIMSISGGAVFTLVVVQYIKKRRS
jgi:glutamine amidotransferase-like uncharacterized protein